MPTSLPQAKFYHQTPLRAKLNSNAFWSSSYAMLQRHGVIWKLGSILNDENQDPYLLKALTEWKVDAQVQQLSKLNEVIWKLQRDDCTLHHSRVYFDSDLEVKSMLEARLMSNTFIVHSPHFESSVVKFRNEKNLDTTTSEKCGLRCLLIYVNGDKEKESDTGTSMDRELKRLKSGSRDGASASAYINTRFLVPTSNLCKRMVSVSGHCLTNSRKTFSS